MTARRPFYGLLTSYFISQIGTAASAVAIPWLVLVTTGSAAQTGLVGFAEMAPYVLLQATSGPLADRLGLHRTTVLGNAVAALLVCAIPALSAAGGLHLATLCALVGVAGATRGAADAAMSPLVPATARLGQLPLERASGLFSGANRTGLLIGLPAAGGLIGLTSPATVVLFDGVSFALAAVGIGLFVPRGAAPQAPGHRLTLRQYGRDLRTGLSFLRRDRLLLGLSVMNALTNLYDQAWSSVLLPVWARDRLHSATGIGMLGGSLSLGLLVGVLAGAWLGPGLPRYWTYAVGFLIAGAPPFLVLAACDTVPTPVVVAFVCGVAGGGLNPITGAALYQRIPTDLQARVLGMSKAGAWAGIPLGSLLGGVVAAAFGLTGALAAFGAAMLLTTLAPFVLPAWRQLDQPPTTTSVGNETALGAPNPA